MIAERRGEVEADRGLEEVELWARLRTSARERARGRLFELHAPFARAIARRRFGLRTGADIEYPDLRQLAYVGLLEAIDRFDPGRGAPFQAFAARRISGAILDGLARHNELRQQTSFRTRLRAERMRSLRGEGAAEAASIAAALAEIETLAVGLALGLVLEGSGLWQEADSVDPAPNPYESLAWAELLSGLRAAVARLPEREERVVRAHYLEGMDFAQIASILGVGRPRVSQIHKAALEKLRSSLRLTGAFDMQS